MEMGLSALLYTQDVVNDRPSMTLVSLATRPRASYVQEAEPVQEQSGQARRKRENQGVKKEVG